MMTLCVQVIIVKVADRLHNMRTVWALQPEKAKYLADETMRVRPRRLPFPLSRYSCQSDHHTARMLRQQMLNC
jgi:hypothetical protein